MSLDKLYYAAKAKGGVEFEEAKAKCLAAGYVIQDGVLSASAAVKDAPPAEPNAAEKFKGDRKGIANAAKD